jgi:ABC-type uncharacterized transport system substrate-binding protein
MAVSGACAAGPAGRGAGCHGSDPQASARLAAIRNGLRERGWSDNLRLDVRFRAGDADSLRANAAELLALKPDAIFAGNTTALAAVHRETRTVPVVFAQVEDPVANGFVASLARPGGNMTGFANFEDEMTAKWLEILKEFAPGITRIGAQPHDPRHSRVGAGHRDRGRCRGQPGRHRQLD